MGTDTFLPAYDKMLSVPITSDYLDSYSDNHTETEPIPRFQNPLHNQVTYLYHEYILI